VRERGMVSTTE